MHIHNHTIGGLGVLSEVTLFQQAQAGCRACLDTLMIRHDGLVQAVVRRQVLGDLPFAEALQAGRIGLWRAIQGYDPKHGTAFSTYAWPCIVRHVWRAVKVHSRFHSPLVPSDGLSSLAGSDPALAWEATAVEQALHYLVQCLPGRLCYVVARYGLDGTLPTTYRRKGTHLSGRRLAQPDHPGLPGPRSNRYHRHLTWLSSPHPPLLPLYLVIALLRGAVPSACSPDSWTSVTPTATLSGP